MARTGEANGHTHQINLSKTSGETDPQGSGGHTHEYDLRNPKTGESPDSIGLHKHTIPRA